MLLSIDYYPYGVSMKERTFGPKTRYQFDGKEFDEETETEDYGMRVYDEDLGIFLTVDPLTAKYPHWTPYQFAGDMPIKYIDLDGLEPSENPKAPNKDIKAAKADVLTIGATSEDANKALNGKNAKTTLTGTQSNQNVIGTLGQTKEDGKNYVSDTYQSSAEQYNMFVQQNGTFKVDESNANQFPDYEHYIINTLLQNFITGEGPENYVFPTDGITSKKLLQSAILGAALTKFVANGNQPLTSQYSFGFRELGRNLMMNNDPFNIEGFLGSGTITIIPNAKGVEVTIFNVTSLSSGAYAAKVPFVSPFNMPKSYVRESNKITPFGNVSQTFKLTLPWAQQQ